METSAFEAYMGNIISNGFLSLAVALGEETGLFSIMCSLEEPATIQNIADKADLKERYVKEWLGSMVAGNIVAVDSESRLYHIPQQYKEFLRSPTIIMSPIVPILASRHGNLQSCLKRDGPTGYDFCQYPQYYTWLRNIREAMADDIVNKDLIPQYGDIKDRLMKGIMVADIGCGTGEICVVLAKQFPNSTFVGLDYGAEAIQKGRALMLRENVTNVQFEEADAMDLPNSWGNRFDLIYAYDVIHDTTDPEKVLSEIRRVMKDDGVFSLIEIDMPSSHFENRASPVSVMNYTFSLYSCLPNSMSVPPSVGLGACWGVDKIRTCLAKNGFNIIKEAQQIIEPNRHFICEKKKLTEA